MVQHFLSRWNALPPDFNYPQCPDCSFLLSPSKKMDMSVSANPQCVPLFVLAFYCRRFFAVLASTAPVVYDTSLYHVQAIEWIEKYGVVKGLGNLHNRLAYNSSFFALQALFSWNSIVGQSLHGMNCFLALFFSSYSIFRIAGYIRHSASAEHPLLEQLFHLLILYIFSRWARDSAQLPFLFLTAVFGATVKLSAASLVVLGIPLCISVLSRKQWKLFGCYAGLCIFLALPLFYSKCPDFRLPSLSVYFV